MIETIRVWWASRRKAKQDERFVAGYKFASQHMQKYGEGGRVYLDDCVECARHFGDSDDFDRGIEAALKESQA